MHVCVCAQVQTPMCVHVEGRGQYQMPSSIAVTFFFEAASFTDPGIQHLSYPGWPVLPGILLSLALRTQIGEIRQQGWFSWLVGVFEQFLVLSPLPLYLISFCH